MTRFPRAPLAAIGLAVTIFGLGVACTAETKPFAGALMLSIQTDLSAPKDVAAIGLYITTDGKPIFADTRDVAPNGEVKFPATIAILADGDRPGAVVKIRAMAFRDTGDVRVLRDIVTTVPKGRTALLRAPLLWINEGSGTGKRQDLFSNAKSLKTLDLPDGFTRIVSACPDGQTFIDGSCADAAVDSSTLPDYRESDVFGGGDATGKGGRCFDVLGCFANGSSISLDATSCTAAGIDANDPNLSFAVSLPVSASTGECNGTTCLVPLDRGTAWKPDASGVSFVGALCARIASGKALGIVKSTACAAKDAATPSCGPASSVTTSGGAPDASVDAPVGSADFDAPLAFEAEPNLSAVVVDASSVYLARTAAQPSPPGVVKIARADVLARKQGALVSLLFGYGAAQTSSLVAGPQPAFAQIVARGASGELRVCTPTSAGECPTFTLIGLPLLALGAVEAYAYGGTGGPPGLYAVNLATPSLSPRAELTGVPLASMVHAGGTLYLGMADGGIQKCAVPCASPSSIVQVRPAPATPSVVSAIAADDRLPGKLFFMQIPADGVTLAAGGIFAIDVSGGNEVALATGADILGGGAPPVAPPAAIAVDAEFVYWGGTFTDPSGGAKKGLLRRNHVTRAPSEPFLESAQGTEPVGSIAVDGTHVFWTYDRAGGALQFARKKRVF